MSGKELKLVSNCYFRQEGVQCLDGELHFADKFGLGPVTVEGETLDCPACEGKGVVLTEDGRQLMSFLEVFARPALRDIVREVMEQERS